MLKSSGQSPDDAEYETMGSDSWAAETRGAYLPYTTPDVIHPIEYGPLTTWGNFLSQNDPLTSENHIHDFGPEFHADPFDGRFSDVRPSAGAWLIPGESSLTNTTYSIYSDQVTAPYRDLDRPEASISVAASSSASALTSDVLEAQRIISPYSGIWAFNPLAVDDNFVYPPTLPTTSSTDTHTSSVTKAVTVSASSIPSPSPVKQAAVTSAGAPRTMHPALPATIPLFANMARPVENIYICNSADSTSLTTSKAKSSPSFAQSSKPARVKRNRVGKSQIVVPRRQGPLSVAQRQKADDMRYYGACWRCRRYKKPCNGPGTCNTCLTSGFRVWPSTIGCYRGNMEDFIVGVMPGNAEQVINRMDFGFKKQPNWKSLFGYRPDIAPIAYNTSAKDKYEALSIKLQATRMAGRGFVELLDILAVYQRSREKPDTCLELVCSALNHICDIYHAFVETDTPIRLDPAELLNALTSFRSTYSDNWRHFLQLCLSGRRSAWFPAFLCACINVPLLVVLKDGFVAIPEPARTTLWPNISFLIEDLRNRLYPMGLDLLSALAKGIRPWKLKCWGVTEHVEVDGSITLQRDQDGMRLLAGDVGAFDGFAAVQHWLSQHRVDMIDGVSFLTTPPFSERNAKMQPIAALAWIFEVNPSSEHERVETISGLVAGKA